MRFPLFSRARRDRELEEEIRSHLAMAVRDRVARGEDPKEAEHAARREFGNETLVRELTRRMWGWTWLEPLWQDVRSALRTLRREKGFAALVVLTLGLGVGSTAVVFGMVDQLLLKPPLGVHDGGRAAYLEFHHPGDAPGSKSQPILAPTFDELRKDATLLDGMASYGFMVGKAAAGTARPVQVRIADVYGDFFEVLGVRPSAGRLLTGSETALGSDPLSAVLSQRLADELFGSAVAAVGKTIRVDSQPLTVVGVAGGGFDGLDGSTGTADLWVPLGALTPLQGISPSMLRNVIALNFLVVRPRTGVSLQAAEAQLQSIFRHVVRLDAKSQSGFYPTYLKKLEPRLYPRIGMQPVVRVRTYRSLRLLVGVVALVMLIACANVANLLLFRNVAGQSAVATRRALGASPWGITRQHLMQSLLLGMLGAGAGLGVGWMISFLFRGQALWEMPTFHRLPLDHRVALFAAAAAIVTTLIFGTIPAALAGRFDLASAMRRSEARHTGRMARLRAALSTGQLALTLTLLVGAGLMLRTVHDLYSADLGMDVNDVTALQLSYGYGRRLSASAIDALYRDVLTTVREIPGVKSAALDLDGLPTMQSGRLALADAPAAEAVWADIEPVTPGWFDVFHVPVIRGRAFREDDWRTDAPARIVLTAAVARRFFGRTNAVGRTVLASFGGKGEPMEVVGVVGDIYAPSDPAHAEDAAFVTYSTWTLLSSDVTLLLRTAHSGSQVIKRVCAAVESILPDEPAPDVASLSTTVHKLHSNDAVLSRLLLLLAGLAALLAAVGLYGIIAFIVAGRRREFGIRIALGAEGSRIVRLVFRYGAVIVGAGTAFGLAGAYVLAAVLRTQLFGVGPLDPTSYFGAAALLALVTALACWLPARRAMRVDPVETLREE